VSLGIVGALVRAWNIRPFAGIFGVYVELIRNTPFLVQLFFIFFGLPSLGVQISEWQAAVLAMVINLGAYSTEIIRAGIQAIPRGQLEAAAALAMTRFEAFRHVVLLPALGKVWPALSSQIIIVMLGSAVCSQIATEELSFAANFIQSRNFRAFETYALTTLIYLCMALLIRQLLNWIGTALHRQEQPMTISLSGTSCATCSPGLQWTLALSLVAFIGGGVIGLLIMVMRISDKALSRNFARTWIELFQGTPLLMQLFLVFFGVALAGIEISPWMAAAIALDAVHQRLSGGDLARLRRVDSQWPVGSLVEPGAESVGTIALRHSAAGPAHRRGANRGVLGASGQRHGRDLDHRLHRTDQDRRHARQRHLRTVHGLWPRRPRLLPAVLSLVPQCALSGKETACLCLEFPPCINTTAIIMCSKAST
jgi:polar amino acid transport system permease protein